MDKILIIKKVADHVEKAQSGESTGHDWWHTKRVWKMAKWLANKEGGNLFIIELAALLHDIADYKFSKTDKEGSKVSAKLLKQLGVDSDIIKHVCQIVDNVSFKGEAHKNQINTIEGMIVQDSDRLDAMGAIGVSRCFAYGGKNDREIYNPYIKPIRNLDFENYKNHPRYTSINHLYEKHLLLFDLLNTESAKRIGKDRHQFTLGFIDQFLKEWSGEV